MGLHREEKEEELRSEMDDYFCKQTRDSEQWKSD